jgi:hypothetical protein
MYIDEHGRLIFEMYNVKAEIDGFDNVGQFSLQILWEK